MTFRRLADRSFEGRPVTFYNDRQNGSVVVFEQPFERGGKARIATSYSAILVHRGDRHRSVLKEPHEAHFGGALRVAALVSCTVERQRARGAGRSIGSERNFMEEPHGYGLASAGLEIKVEDLGLHFTWRCIQRRQQRRALTRNDVPEPQRAGADLSEVVIEPGRERRVQVDNVATGIDRKEPGWRVIEIVDGVLQFLEHVLLTLALTCDVGDRPYRHARVAPSSPSAYAQRSHRPPPAAAVIHTLPAPAASRATLSNR